MPDKPAREEAAKDAKRALEQFFPPIDTPGPASYLEWSGNRQMTIVLLQHLQRDLLTLRPEMAVLFCHGTKEGCLLLEDGRGKAAVTPGDRVLAVLDPRPRAVRPATWRPIFLPARRPTGSLSSGTRARRTLGLRSKFCSKSYPLRS